MEMAVDWANFEKVLYRYNKTGSGYDAQGNIKVGRPMST